MFAILALVAFILAALHVSLGGLDMVAVGLALLTVEAVVFWRPWVRYRGN